MADQCVCVRARVTLMSKSCLFRLKGKVRRAKYCSNRASVLSSPMSIALFPSMHRDCCVPVAGSGLCRPSEVVLLTLGGAPLRW
uniref:Uncharacterized protein n=1 Tax=Astyanax mexicanus TaxID=7994 RepID=A0A3B1IL38_ASTMX